MKKIYLLLLSVMLFCCDNDKKGLIEEYDTIVKKSDRIRTVHQNLAAQHDKMTAEHYKLSEELKGIDIMDSTLLEDMRKHGMMLERHDAILKSHQEIIDAHNTTDPNFDELNAIELQDKIDSMKKWHETMRNDHEMMKNEHNRIMDEHKSLKEKLLMDSKEKMN
ncbi:hypothetical protein [Winogradskyella sp.]|uniref:hypothetical protein n=1 Tax=Winogradskyella sp. TaxID=1883156 RepID=UPI003F6CB8E0